MIEVNFLLDYTTDYGPCNYSHVVFECKETSEYITFVIKILILLPYHVIVAYLLSKNGFRGHGHKNSHIAVCVCIITRTIMSFCINKFVLIDIHYNDTTQILKYASLSNNLYTLGIIMYISDLGKVLSFIESIFARILIYVLKVLKFIYLGIVLLKVIAIISALPMSNKFVRAICVTSSSPTKLIDKFIIGITVFVLSYIVQLLPLTSHLFSPKLWITLSALIFVFSLAEFLSTFAFETANSYYFMYFQYYKKRETYKYVFILIQFLYFDFQPMIFAFIVFLLSVPNPDTHTDHPSELEATII